MDRILTLVDATETELHSHNDVCAICYSDMQSSAKVTPCGHYFHGGCLKKWLFVQDHCPMCSAKIIEEEQSTTSASPDVQEQVVLPEAAEAESANVANVEGLQASEDEAVLRPQQPPQEEQENDQ